MSAKEQEQGTDDGAEGKDKKEKKDINEMKEPEVDDDHVSHIFTFSYNLFCFLKKSGQYGIEKV